MATELSLLPTGACLFRQLLRTDPNLVTDLRGVIGSEDVEPTVV